jgi:hypothetical protein
VAVLGSPLGREDWNLMSDQGRRALGQETKTGVKLNLDSSPSTTTLSAVRL